VNTFPILYSRTAKGAVNTWKVWTEGSTVVCEWGQVGGKLQISRFECTEKNIGRANETSAEEQAVLEAAAKHTAQLRKKYVETLDKATEETKISPMLAKLWEDHKNKVVYGAYIQPKLDGLRALALLKDGKVVLQSRGNKTYSLPHIERELATILQPGMVLDGELYLHGTSLQTINSWVRGKKPEAVKIQYHLYDMVTDDDFSVRTKKLEEVIEPNLMSGVPNPGLVLVDTHEVKSEEHVRQLQEHFIAKGYEGAIVRTATGKYRYGYRSPDLLKLKNWLDSEFRIIGFQVGKGKFQNVPTFKCATADGQSFDVTPKGTEEERLQMLKKAEQSIGQLLTVRYFMLSPSGIPLYPVGGSIRHVDDLS
jgi:DNA ligase-1